LRTIRAAFDELNFKADLLKHGIGREVYVCDLAVNAKKILRGERKKAVYRGLKTVDEVGSLARARWLVPRSIRRPEYKNWQRDQFRDLVLHHRIRSIDLEQSDVPLSQSAE
jgi:hypothetical protein